MKISQNYGMCNLTNGFVSVIDGDWSAAEHSHGGMNRVHILKHHHGPNGMWRQDVTPPCKTTPVYTRKNVNIYIYIFLLLSKQELQNKYIQEYIKQSNKNVHASQYRTLWVLHYAFTVLTRYSSHVPISPQEENISLYARYLNLNTVHQRAKS